MQATLTLYSCYYQSNPFFDFWMSSNPMAGLAEKPKELRQWCRSCFEGEGQTSEIPPDKWPCRSNRPWAPIWRLVIIPREYFVIFVLSLLTFGGGGGPLPPSVKTTELFGNLSDCFFPHSSQQKGWCAAITIPFTWSVLLNSKFSIVQRTDIEFRITNNPHEYWF